MKKIFRSIVNWVRENPPVQPLLFILVIFVGIFALTRVVPAWEWVQGQFTTDTKKATEIDYEELEKMVDSPEDKKFLLFYGQEGCSACEEMINTSLNRFLRSKYKVPTYYFDAVAAQRDDNITETQLQLLLEKLNLGFSGIDYYNEPVDPENPLTPTLYLFNQKLLKRIHVGQLTYPQLKDFVNLDSKFKI